MLTRKHNISPAIVFWIIVILFNICYFTSSAMPSHPPVIMTLWAIVTGLIILGCILYELMKKTGDSTGPDHFFSVALKNMKTARKYGISSYYTPTKGVTKENRIGICINYAASFHGINYFNKKNPEIDRLTGIIVTNGWQAGILAANGDELYLKIVWHAKELSECLAAMPVDGNGSRGKLLNLVL